MKIINTKDLQNLIGTSPLDEVLQVATNDVAQVGNIQLIYHKHTNSITIRQGDDTEWCVISDEVDKTVLHPTPQKLLSWSNLKPQGFLNLMEDNEGVTFNTEHYGNMTIQSYVAHYCGLFRVIRIVYEDDILIAKYDAHCRVNMFGMKDYLSNLN